MEGIDNWREIRMCGCRDVIKRHTTRLTRHNWAHWSSGLTEMILWDVFWCEMNEYSWPGCRKNGGVAVDNVEAGKKRTV